jgi:long-chain acyl-CoA synthetase
MKKTIIDLFESSVKKYKENNLLLKKTGTQFMPTSYSEACVKAIRIGAGLATLGVKPKDRVSILSEGRNAWVLSELGVLYAGAISVPLSIKLEESSDLIFRLNHAEVSFILVSVSQLPKIRKIKNELTLLKKVVIFDNIENLDEKEILLSEVEKSGVTYLEKNEKEFLTIGQSLQNDDYATITYTSGTTADPKGVILTHRNYTANVEQSLTCMSIPPSFRTLIILPLDHCFAHVVGFYIMIACGASFATVQVGRNDMETLKNIPINIKEVKPNFLLSVPALAKNFRKNIENNIYAKGKIAKGLFNLALKTAYAYNKDGYRNGFENS